MYDSDAVATNVVTSAASVREGDLVLISGAARDQRLLEDLAVQVRRQGAFPFVELNSDRMARRLVVDVPEQYDTQAPELGMKLVEMFDVMISVDSNDDPALMSDVPPARLAARAQAAAPLNERAMERGIRSVNLGNDIYPSDANAEQFGMDRQALGRMFWDAVAVPPTDLAARGERVKQVLSSANELHITAPNGTDITVGIANRPVLISDGAISAEDQAQGGAANQVWLPAGEVYLAPVPGTANGTVVVDAFRFQGTPVEGLRLTFQNGKLTEMTAESGLEGVKAAYDAAGAGKDQLGVIDIGLNPALQVQPDDRLRSWVSSGIVSISIGSNLWAGGSNNASYGFAGHIAGATVMADGTAIVENGQLVGG
jgi:leucyl aminopeptidase (aminopeptidase T)